MATSFLLNLPDDIWFNILTFAAEPTTRASVLCHQIQPLCSSMNNSIETQRCPLWLSILYQDYKKGISSTTHHNNNDSPRRRASKRVRRTPKDDVRDAHLKLGDETEIAHVALFEMARSRKTPLSLRRLRLLFRKHNPILTCHHRCISGLTFLMECCSASHVEESVVLRCVKELMEKHGALPDDVSSSNAELDGGLTPLCIAAGRGMPSVVQYLIRMGASPDLEGTGRLLLSSNFSKSVHGTYTPLGFTMAMREAEISAGLNLYEVKALDKCIQILTKKRKPKGG